MREVDFSERNEHNRWLGVKSIWQAIQGEVKRYVRGELQRLMRVDVTAYLGCGRYHRSPDRSGYRNGSYARDLLTSYGWINGLSVPRVRDGGFSPSVLEKYRRRQRQVDLVLLEAFLLGHATRKTRRLCRRLFGAELSAQTISNIVRELDEEVLRFHRRELADDYRFVYLDGLWIVLRRPFKTRQVLLVALGVRADGTKELLSFQLAGSESESCWWGFVSDLKQRGLAGRKLELIVSDGAGGLVKAITALYPRVPQQRCVFHKAMDLGAYLSQPGHRRRIIADAFRIFEATTEVEASKRLQAFCDKWSSKEPAAVRNFLRGFQGCLTYLRYPEELQTMLKTTNPLERYLEELRRRIIPMRSFNNAKSVERIVYGIIAYVLNDQPDMPLPQFTQSS